MLTMFTYLQQASRFRNMTMAAIATLLMSILTATTAKAQSAFDRIHADRYFSASNYRVYPDSNSVSLTPAPKGKEPFYISHYGRHGSRYLSSRHAYTTPYKILQQAQEQGKLTPLGTDVLQQLGTIIEDSQGHWGDLSALGQQQHRNIARRMVERYPQLFTGQAHIQARSTTSPRCILSMGAAMLQLKAMNPQLVIDMDASHADMWYLNFQDKQLRDSMMTYRAKQAFKKFTEHTIHNPRLMTILFNDTAYANEQDDAWLNYYLLKTELIQQNTHMYDKVQLSDLFTVEDLYLFWQQENAWWYIQYGPSPLNGGQQPYTQRKLLRRIIADADSCIAQTGTNVQMRFGHDTMLLPLTCLLGINGYDMQTERLEELEERGWWAVNVFPMASNIQFVFYRENPTDTDVVFKVLLNEQEATLPLPTDMAPYYHWRDFRAHYLKKLDDYERERFGH